MTSSDPKTNGISPIATTYDLEGSQTCRLVKADKSTYVVAPLTDTLAPVVEIEFRQTNGIDEDLLLQILIDRLFVRDSQKPNWRYGQIQNQLLNARQYLKEIK